MQEITVNFLSKIFGKEVLSFSLEVLNEGLVASAKVQVLHVKVLSEGKEENLRFVVKATQDTFAALSKQIGLAREAIFFSTLSAALNQADLPTVHFAEGCMESGRQLVIMEDLSSAIQSGYFFGPGNPMNWGKDLHALTSSCSDVSSEAMAEEAFVLAARLHAAYWNSSQLLDHPWLRGSDWARGEGRESWENAQQLASSSWRSARAAAAAQPGGVRWSEELVAIGR